MTPPHAKRWEVAPPTPPSHIARFTHLHPITVRVLYNRGVIDPADVDAFLNGDRIEANPFELDGVPEAVTRLRQALRAGEPITVYGDFDADGVTATALLTQTLRALGGRVEPYIPDRADEGYGLQRETLTELAESGASLIVTVDCGIRSLKEIEHANRVGLDVIVTDHHSVGPDLPDAVAVIDPKRRGGRYPFNNLAGVGVAFKLAQALLRSHRQTPVTEQAVRLEEEDLTDLVALGTVTDLVPLTGENRTLVKRGLERLNRMDRPGVAALCRQAGLQADQVSATTIGYVLGPRLNAAGRMAHANVAYQLLATQFPAEAERLAGELDRLNRQRQELTADLHARARQMALDAEEEATLIFIAASDFPTGVVGLVASRLVEDFYRPAVIVELSEDGTSRGSARSIAEFHITDALDRCADLLIRHGGHAAAAGLTVPNENLDILAERLRAMATQRLADVDLRPILEIDAEVDLAQMSWDLQSELARLEPCGRANPHPLFLSRSVEVRGQRAVGRQGRHLKLKLCDGQTVWDAIAFRQGDWAGNLPGRVDVAYHLEVNEWRDRRRLQLNVRDIRPAEASA